MSLQLPERAPWLVGQSAHATAEMVRNNMSTLRYRVGDVQDPNARALFDDLLTLIEYLAGAAKGESNRAMAANMGDNGR